MKIRKAKKEDLKEIDRIYVEGSIDEGKLQFPNISEKKMLNELNKVRKERVKGFRKNIQSKNNYWIIIEKESKIAGFGNVEINKNYEKKEGIITMVYVDRKFRKKGIGRKIMKELIKWLENKKVNHIESAAYWNNKPSIKLQKKLGFKPISLKMRLK